MFDLPVVEESDKIQYAKFRKSLISNGFIMIQYSIYCKSTNIKNKYESEVEKIKKFIPQSGNIRILYITECQYQNMIFLVGGKTISEEVNKNERYIKI